MYPIQSQINKQHSYFLSNDNPLTDEQKATLLVEIILKGKENECNHFSINPQLKVSLSLKLTREPTSRELEAKIYSLALKCIKFFHLMDLGEALNYIIDKKTKTPKLAPHKKLFGLSIQALKFKQDGSQSLLINTSNVKSGTFNTVYPSTLLLSTMEWVALRALKQSYVLNENYHQTIGNKEVALHHHFQEKLLGIIGIKEIIDFTLSSSSTKQFYPYKGLVLQSCEGDLNHLLTHHSLSKLQLYDLALQLLETLSQLHTLPHLEKNKTSNQIGYTHGDLKPGNLLYYRHDERFILKLADFGAVEEINQRDIPLGTYSYQPPQTFLFGNKCGIEIDAWSTGLILFELKYGLLVNDFDLSLLYLKLEDQIKYLNILYLLPVGFLDSFPSSLLGAPDYIAQTNNMTILEASQLLERWQQAGLLSSDHYLNSFYTKSTFVEFFQKLHVLQNNAANQSVLSESAIQHYQFVLKQKNREVAIHKLLEWHAKSYFTHNSSSNFTADFFCYLKKSLHNYCIDVYLNYFYKQEFQPLYTVLKQNPEDPINQVIFSLLDLDLAKRTNCKIAYHFLKERKSKSIETCS